MGEEKDPTHTSKEKSGAAPGQRKAQVTLEISVISNQDECDKFQANEGTLQIFNLHPLVGSCTAGQNNLVCIYHTPS